MPQEWGGSEGVDSAGGDRSYVGHLEVGSPGVQGPAISFSCISANLSVPFAQDKCVWCLSAQVLK